MRIWTVIRILAGTVVVAIMIFTAVLAYHVNVSPVGGWFSRLIPEPGSLDRYQAAEEFALRLEASEMPEIEPGELAFQRAHDLLAMGHMQEAREKLTTIFNVFPNSPTATTARQIVGEMNLDEILGGQTMAGKQLHTVKRGDSYLAIAAKYQTTVDLMIHLNSMLELKGIQPGDELIVMPLNFRLLIEPKRLTVSIWKDGKFIREYTALSMNGVPDKPKQTSISQKVGEINGSSIPSHLEEYRGANKILQLASPSLQIRSWQPTGESEAPRGILLRPDDMEELALLTRPGNEVEIR